jgi:hypothetical protein
LPRPCSACLHDERAAIDAAIVEGRSYRAIARQHGLSKDAVARHVAHVSKALVSIAAQQETAGAETLLGRVESLIRRAEAFLAAAEKTGQVAQGLSAIREIRALLELLGKASGELKADGVNVSLATINVLASPEITRYTTELLRALQPYPAARVAAAAALQLLDMEVPA